MDAMLAYSGLALACPGMITRGKQGHAEVNDHVFEQSTILYIVSHPPRALQEMVHGSACKIPSSF